MSLLIIILISLVFIIVYQIAKASEYATVLRGEKKMKAQTNRTMAALLLALFVVGMYGVYRCHEAMMPMMMPESASVQGVHYDSMLKTTTIVTGIVFVITQALLFWFSYRYQASEKRTAFYYAHNNKLELIWTTIPAIVMALLVAVGLRAWFSMTDTAPKDAQVAEIVGKQFNWIIRYPGADGVLGRRDFRDINDADNVLGMDRKDANNQDDIISQNGELHVVKGKSIKLVIGSRDVIHDVGLPHFRYKMDAVPGITTSIWFTPRVSTEEMKVITKNPDFVYEISCDQICGKGHYSMRGIVIVHDTQAELDKWFADQPAYLASGAAPAAMPANGTATPTDSTGTQMGTPASRDSSRAVTHNQTGGKNVKAGNRLTRN